MLQKAREPLVVDQMAQSLEQWEEVDPPPEPAAHSNIKATEIFPAFCISTTPPCPPAPAPVSGSSQLCGPLRNSGLSPQPLQHPFSLPEPSDSKAPWIRAASPPRPGLLALGKARCAFSKRWPLARNGVFLFLRPGQAIREVRKTVGQGSKLWGDPTRLTRPQFAAIRMNVLFPRLAKATRARLQASCLPVPNTRPRLGSEEGTHGPTGGTTLVPKQRPLFLCQLLIS